MAFITITVTPAEASAIRGSEDLAGFTRLAGTSATFHKNNPAHLLYWIDLAITRRTSRGRPCEELSSIRRKVEGQSGSVRAS